ncbi:VOC family protein [Streptomyces sp. H23]|uniref:VOC family protein n=1 Tax=Streptomyces sp. H23 TaxID=2541723 RepID=UPI00142F5381|nr:VOC family protein [Streptomyces sp. H23]
MPAIRGFQVTIDCAEPERLARFWCEVPGFAKNRVEPGAPPRAGGATGLTGSLVHLLGPAGQARSRAGRSPVVRNRVAASLAQVLRPYG